MDTEFANDEKYMLQSVNNALTLIDLLAGHPDSSITEITSLSGMGKSTVFRTIYTLKRAGYLSKDENGRYRLGFKFAVLGSLVNEQDEMIRLLHPYLEELTALTGETSHLVRWKDDTKVIFIDKVNSSNTIIMQAAIGYTVQAHYAGTGKVLLAYANRDRVDRYLQKCSFESIASNTITDKDALLKELDTIRANSCSCNDEESEDGMVCYAVPIRQGKKVTAAVSIAGPAGRMRENREKNIKVILESMEKMNRCLNS